MLSTYGNHSIDLHWFLHYGNISFDGIADMKMVCQKQILFFSKKNYGRKALICRHDILIGYHKMVWGASINTKYWYAEYVPLSPYFQLRCSVFFVSLKHFETFFSVSIVDLKQHAFVCWNFISKWYNALECSWRGCWYFQTESRQNFLTSLQISKHDEIWKYKFLARFFPHR